MKSRKDAERVVELCARREELHTTASTIRTADDISVCTEFKTKWHSRTETKQFTFEHLTEELRDLIRREADAQIVEIDRELKALGVVPDEFDAAAPDDPGVVKMQVLRA